MTEEIRIPICEFGKKLDVKDIIEKVEYAKGNKNDIGDSPNDYVRIILKEKVPQYKCKYCGIVDEEQCVQDHIKCAQRFLFEEIK